MRFWLGVVSKEHALVGIKRGFVQVCHGKAGPLRRMKAGDLFVFYSPREQFRGKPGFQRFTGLGIVKDGRVYQADMGGGFKPYRVDVEFARCQEAAIRPLIERLSFIANKKSWGFVFKRGHFEVPKEDFELIAGAMGVDLAELVESAPVAEEKVAPAKVRARKKPPAPAPASTDPESQADRESEPVQKKVCRR